MSSRPARLHYGWIILVVGTLVVFGAQGLARFGYSIVLPAMQTSLHLDNAQAGALATANLVGYLLLAVIGGALAARFGARKVITAGLALVGAAMLVTGLSHSFFTTALWRAVTGLGSGASNVPVMGLLAAWFARRRRGIASGIAVSGASLAMISLGQVVPPVLHAYGENGWRVSWALFGAATLVIALIALIFLRDRPAQMGLVPLGADADETPAQAAGGGLAWSSVYRSAAVWHLGMVYVAYGFSYMIYMTFFVKHLIAAGHYDPPAAGSLFKTMGYCSLACGLLWGGISDVIGRKYALLIVYLLHTVAFALFGLWQEPAGFTISAILFGISAWSIPAIMAAACGDMLGPRLAPAGLGFITLFFGIGQALGPYVAGVISDRAHTLAPSFLLASGVALLGAIGTVTLRQTSSR